jgi:phosphatidylglycerol lysyltransferase
LLRALRAHARDAVAYQALEADIRLWRCAVGMVSFCDTKSGWVACGGPLADDGHVDEVARAFVAEAGRHRKRASFFACDEVARFDASFARFPIGEQPLWRTSEWPATVRAHRRLREQLRRARAKGVTVREVSATELAPDRALRGDVDALAARWLASRPMEPMRFLVTLDLFVHPALHRYYVAERAGAVVAFLSVIPAGGASRALVEDLVRDRLAPNGTTELLFDRAARDAAAQGIVTLTWGLAPLAGDVSWSMRLLGSLGRGLYDFRGLKAFKARLHPTEWQRVWLVHPRGASPALYVLDALRAFAGGSTLTFGVRTFVLHPRVLAWVLTLGLVPWTLSLALLLAFHAAAPLFGFPREKLFAWVVFDAAFLAVLVRAFWRPRAGRFVVLALAAGADAVWSTLHLMHAGLGASPAAAAIRLASAIAPALAAFGLLRCASYARRPATG